jgi:hypothetical protein
LPVVSGRVPIANVWEVCGLVHATGAEALLGWSVSLGVST